MTPSSHFPPDQIHSLNREVSLYLDVCRFLAAVMVFVSHAANRQISGGFLWQIGGFGEDAVAVFFVLSGFVIGYVTDVRETDARSYAVNRLARLYSVALPALVLTFLLDAAGAALRPEFYSPAYIAYGAGDQPWRAATGLLFLNEIWNTHTVMGSNGPYWSMGFEAWYYIAFGLAVFGPARWRIPACLLALVIAGPKIAALFPLWLGGVALFHFMKRASLPAAMGWLLFLGGAGAVSRRARALRRKPGAYVRAVRLHGRADAECFVLHCPRRAVRGPYRGLRGGIRGLCRDIEPSRARYPRRRRDHVRALPLSHAGDAVRRRRVPLGRQRLAHTAAGDHRTARGRGGAVLRHRTP